MGGYRSRVAAAVGMACGIGAAASLGCALLVGETDGHRLFPDVDGAAGGQTPDATGAPEAADAAESSTPIDAAADAGPTDGATETGPDGSAAQGVRCTRQYCAPGEVCCVNNVYDLPDGAACTSPAQCFSPSAFFCDSQKDCAEQGHPNDRCCAPLIYTTNMGIAYEIAQGSQCSPSCAPNLNAVLCDPSVANDCAPLDAGCRALAHRPNIYFSCQ
jgi:hypothetical protein